MQCDKKRQNCMFKNGKLELLIIG